MNKNDMRIPQKWGESMLYCPLVIGHSRKTSPSCSGSPLNGSQVSKNELIFKFFC